MSTPRATAGPSHSSVVVIGAGQAGLSAGYYLRRAGLRPGEGYVIVDTADRPGGAWRLAWPSLRLFSPASQSSLPGWPMPPWAEGFPRAQHVVDYLTSYELRYSLPVLRPIDVHGVHDGGPGEPRYRVSTSAGDWTADAVISTTGTWGRPFWPAYPGQHAFAGRQLHTADYRGPEELAGAHVVVVGGGNSAAQLLAEISTVATTTWVTQHPPRFLPDDVDGRVLFAMAAARAAQLASGQAAAPAKGAALGDIVMVPSVREARERGVLHSEPMFSRLTPDGVSWTDGRRQRADVVLWCTGFRPALSHLAPLRLPRIDGHALTEGTRAAGRTGLHLLGYGDWTGPASATLIGVGRTARAAVDDIVQHTLTSTGTSKDRGPHCGSGRQ